MDIYSLYVTRSKDERAYFYKLLKHIALQFSFIKIVHLDFKYNSVYHNMKYNDKLIKAVVYTFNKGNLDKTFVDIYNLEDLKKLFKKNPGFNKNLFVYSGHSNGLYLIKHNIRILRIQDFCEIINFTLNGEKADLLIYDCCLCGNINCLSISYHFAKYVIASSSYWSYMSVLMTNSIYLDNTNVIDYSKDIINEFISLEKKDPKSYFTNIVLYSMNEYLLQFINLVLQNHKIYLNKKNNVIDYSYYKSLDCIFKKNDLLRKIVIYQRFKKNNCNSKKLSKRTNHSNPTKMMIILKSPVKDIPTDGDIFFLTKLKNN